MPTCLFILQRFYLRVDHVLVRTCDTRIYHEVHVRLSLITHIIDVSQSWQLMMLIWKCVQLGWDYLLREYCEREDSFNDIKVCICSYSILCVNFSIVTMQGKCNRYTAFAIFHVWHSVCCAVCDGCAMWLNVCFAAQMLTNVVQEPQMVADHLTERHKHMVRLQFPSEWQRRCNVVTSTSGLNSPTEKRNSIKWRSTATLHDELTRHSSSRSSFSSLSSHTTQPSTSNPPADS